MIHCSAGIGRTGTIISIYNIIQTLKILQETHSLMMVKQQETQSPNDSSHHPNAEMKHKRSGSTTST